MFDIIKCSTKKFDFLIVILLLFLLFFYYYFIIIFIINKNIIFTIFSTFFGEIEPKNDKLNSFDQKCTVFVYFYGAFDTFRAQFH